MPNILVNIPHGAYPGEARAGLVRRIDAAAAAVEQIPADPKNRFLCWIRIDEVAAGAWTCGGADMTARVLPCCATIQLPHGVLDAASRATYVQRMHDAFRSALPAGERRQLATSVVLHEVADGAWGVNGEIWSLADFARSAGFVHLRHLVS